MQKFYLRPTILWSIFLNKFIISNHLAEMPGLAFPPNGDLSKDFAIPQIAQKHALLTKSAFLSNLIIYQRTPEDQYGQRKNMSFTNHELQLANDFVQTTGCNIFLTGKAGTGKKTIEKYGEELVELVMTYRKKHGINKIQFHWQFYNE